MSTFANSKDPDEMQHNAAFHQGLYYFQKKEYPGRQKIYIFFF